MSLMLVAGDTAPIKRIYKVDGVPQDITGFAFTLKIAGDPVKNLVSTTTDAPGGKFEFRPGATDLIAGNPQAEIMITFPDGTEETHKLGTIQILPRL